MKCKIIEQWLPLHAGGDLGRFRSHLVERHIEECSACAEELRALQVPLEVCRDLRENRPSPNWDGLWHGIQQGINETDDEKALSPAPVPYVPTLGDRVLQGLALAACIFMAVTLGRWIVESNGTPESDSSSTVAQQDATTTNEDTEAPVEEELELPPGETLAGGEENDGAVRPVVHRFEDLGGELSPLDVPRRRFHQEGWKRPQGGRGDVMPTSF